MTKDEQEKIEHIIKVLQILKTTDSIEIIQCTIDSIIEDLQEQLLRKKNG